MDIKDLIDHYSAYDLWANARVHQRLSTVEAKVLDADVKSSFPSLRATMMHIRNAEATWLARMTGAEVKWPASPTDGLETFLVHVQAMHQYARSLDQDGLLAEVTYADLKGNAHTQTRWSILMHCFNHSTYHRGQIVTLMRQLDVLPIPALDLVVYQRSLAQGGS